MGPLQRIAEAYVPYRVYRAHYEVGRTQHSHFFALDAVSGGLDLFQFPCLPTERDLVTVQTRNCLSPSLQLAQAHALLHEKVLRVIFQRGFFKLRDPKLEIAPNLAEFHVPYWLAFHGRNVLHCRVLDAVRRRIEGAKASALFEEWLAA